MSEEKKSQSVPLKASDPVPFDYPEGFKAVAATLTFLPEEAREPTLTALFTGILIM
jgi:hypothetical protein